MTSTVLCVVDYVEVFTCPFCKEMQEGQAVVVVSQQTELPRGGSINYICEDCARKIAVASVGEQLDAYRDVLSKIVSSGILCEPGCCGDDCGCDDARAIVEGAK